MASSALLQLRQRFTIEEAARVLTNELGEDIGFSDVAAMIEEGRLPMEFCRRIGPTPMMPVAPFSPVQIGYPQERWRDHFWVERDAKIEYRSGYFRAYQFYGMHADDIADLSPEAQGEESVLSGVVYYSDWDGGNGAGLIVADQGGTLFQVLREDYDAGGVYVPYQPPLNSEEFTIPAADITALLRSVREPTPPITRSCTTDSQSLSVPRTTYEVRDREGGQWYWRAVLACHFPRMVEQHGPQVRARQAIRYLKGIGDPRVDGDTTADGLRWKTDVGDWRTVSVKTVGNALSELRAKRHQA